MTYRSRGRSTIEVIFVSDAGAVSPSLPLSTLLRGPRRNARNDNLTIRFCAMHRPVALYFSWLALSQFYALEITFGRNGHKNVNGNEGWPSWREIIQVEEIQGTMRLLNPLNQAYKPSTQGSLLGVNKSFEC